MIAKCHSSRTTSLRCATWSSAKHFLATLLLLISAANLQGCAAVPNGVGCRPQHVHDQGQPPASTSSGAEVDDALPGLFLRILMRIQLLLPAPAPTRTRSTQQGARCRMRPPLSQEDHVANIDQVSSRAQFYHCGSEGMDAYKDAESDTDHFQEGWRVYGSHVGDHGGNRNAFYQPLLFYGHQPERRQQFVQPGR
ncbi:unnamed protein product [Amoebophrya sp. A25]|nr:unnamed protein product [Amoebophrya sp. A25]|eukprot:GSA25T00022255001.1